MNANESRMEEYLNGIDEQELNRPVINWYESRTPRQMAQLKLDIGQCIDYCGFVIGKSEGVWKVIEHLDLPYQSFLTPQEALDWAEENERF